MMILWADHHCALISTRNYRELLLFPTLNYLFGNCDTSSANLQGTSFWQNRRVVPLRDAENKVERNLFTGQRIQVMNHLTESVF